MSVVANYLSQLTVIETLAVGVPAASTPSITHSGYNTTEKLNSSSTPAATKAVANSYAMTAGAKTLDLTALVGTNGATVDGTGLDVVAFKVINPAGNSALVVKFGASNPYLFGADAAWRHTLKAGDELLLLGRTNPTIGSGAKNIDFSGTGTESFQVVIVMG